MIQPGLQRITKLLAQTPLTWRAIHIAGTNGKGTTCAYINAILREYNNGGLPEQLGHNRLSYGRFTSPHLVDRWDCIRINDQVIPKKDFLDIESHFKDHDRKNCIGASEFELLTATAFEAFNQAKVEVGIVEVGMGGRDDATNIIGQQQPDGPARAKPLATVITSIALDHQGFLGDTIEEIAAHKAGIMKPGVPFVFAEQSSSEKVTAVLRDCARRCGAPPVTEWLETIKSLGDQEFQSGMDWHREGYWLGGGHHPCAVDSLEIAGRAAFSALEQLGRIVRPQECSKDEYLKSLQDLVGSIDHLNKYTIFPGRYEPVVVHDPTKTEGPMNKRFMLIDGAHNPAAAQALADHLEVYERKPRTWVIASSQGRSIGDFLRPLLQPGDSVFTVEFVSVAGMPWVKPTPADEILAVIRQMGIRLAVTKSCGSNVHQAILEAFKTDAEQDIIVTGSLYLVGDVHRLFRDKILVRDEPMIHEWSRKQFCEPYSQA